MNTNKSYNKFWLMALAMLPMMSFAQEASAKSSSYFSNALFNTLLAVIFILVIVIIGMANVLKNLAQSEYFQNKLKEEKQNNSGSAKIGAVILFALISSYANAQDAVVAVKKDDWLIGGLDYFTFYFMLFIIIIELIFIVGLYTAIKRLLQPDTIEEAVAVSKPAEKTIFDKLNAAVEIERESEIMLDHDYDGIKELDNDLPPWWKYGFYLTIVIAFVYLVHYHISGTGDLQEAEYNKEIAAAKAEVEAYMKTAANNVDETNVKMMDNTADIEAGKANYLANCAACHGRLGEGGVGPNFADDFWMHGGSIQDIFKTIKYGYPDKGMKAWKDDLSPIQIAQISSFIKTLKGTNPPNAKAPQGDLYNEGGAAPAVSDSVKVAAPADSTAQAATEKK